MTTVAFDGTTLAADSLVTDNWGMKDSVCKILKGKDFVAGGAGERSKIMKWWKVAKDMSFDELLQYGYPDYDSEKNDPALLIAHKTPCSGVFKHSGGGFVLCGRSFHAVGSGRDYALAAMHLGKTATEAVQIAMLFDNTTGGEIDTVQVTSYD